MALKIITRKELGIEDREGGVQWNESALLGITVHHFGIPRAAATAALSRRLWLGVDNSHEAGEFNDIAYNFGVDDFGQIMEGRGWDWMTGANGTNFSNRNYLSIVYMGHSGLDKFSDVAQKHMAWLFKQAFGKGVGVTVVPHRKWTGSECPGSKAHSWVVNNGWKADMPVKPKRVQFFLLDDGKIIDKSAIVPISQSAERWKIFRNSNAASLAHKHMAAEGVTGNVQFVRKVLA